MVAYLLLLFITVLGCFIEMFVPEVYEIKNRKINLHKISFILTFISILIIGILRNEYLGVDSINYEVHFKNAKYFDFISNGFNLKQDYGYLLLSYIVRIFTNNYWLFKALIYIFNICLFGYIVKKESKYPCLSFLIYLGLGYLGLNFCILRQSIAIAICFYSFKYVKSKKNWKFIFTVMIAISFHKTAALFLITYFIVNYKPKRINSMQMKLIYMILMLISFQFLLPVLLELYSRKNYSDIVVSGSGYNLLIFYIVVLFICWIIKKKTIKKSIELPEYDASFISIYLQIGATYFSLFTRMVSYYSIFLTIVIPNLLNKSSKKKLFFIVFIAIFTFMFLFTLNGTKIVPYQIH